MGFLFPMMAGMLLLPLLLLLPGFGRLESHWRVTVVFGVLGLCFVAAALVGLAGRHANHQELGPEDPWRQMVEEVAEQAGVRVRHVVRVRSASVNAYASLLGTVGLTSALLRKMEPNEVRAVIAHEIGHHKHGHVRRGFTLSLLLLAVFLPAWWFGTNALKPHVSEVAYTPLRGPLIGTFLSPIPFSLVLGRGQRKREEEADRFAAQTTGDPELVIRTLVKLHTLNASPHQLKRADEVISSHPSLARRIAALRRAFPAERADPATVQSGHADGY